MKQLAALLMSAIILISCNGPRPDPECVDAGDLGADLRQNALIMSSNDGWTDTKLNVQQGKKLTIRTSGEIFLCMSTPQIDEVRTFSPTSTPAISANIGTWQDTGFTLKQGYKYTFEVSGAYSIFPNDNSGCGTTYNDNSDCWSRQGKGLFAYIGSATQDAWFGTENQDDADGVFEMYRRDPSPSVVMPNNIGYGVGIVLTDKKLWLRYRDADSNNPDPKISFEGANQYDSAGNNWYANNRGGYTITSKRYSMCFGGNGKFVKAKIVPDGGTPTDTDNIPSIDISKCSEPGDAPTDANASYCNNGTYVTPSTPSAGRVWMRVVDVLAADGSAGDGIYTPYITGASTTVNTIVPNISTAAKCSEVAGSFSDGKCTISQIVVAAGTGSNSGQYNVIMTTPRPQNGGSVASIINTIVEPVRTLLRGTKDGWSMVGSVSECAASSGTVSTMTCSGLDTVSTCSAVGGTLAGSLCTNATSCNGGEIAQVKCSVTNKTGLTERLYKNLTLNGEFVQGVRALIALAAVLFAFYYMAGLSSITHKELLHLIFKIAIVEMIISPDSWEFFNTYLFSLFIDGSDNLIWIMSNNINSLIANAGNATMAGSGTTGAEQGRAVFGFLNTTMEIMFSQQTWIKIQALLTSFPLGIFYVAIMIIGIIYFLFALVKALFMYLTAIIMMAVLLFMAPIFICFILFKKTNEIFKKWIAQLAIYALQPVLLFVVIAVFNVFILASLYAVLDFTACYTCVWYLDLPISEIFDNNLGNFDRFCLIPGYVPWGTDSEQSIFIQIAKTPVALFSILIFIIFANAMLKFVGWVDAMAQQLVGEAGAGLSTPGQAVSNLQGTGIMNQATGIVKGTKTFAFASVKSSASTADWLAGGKLSDGLKVGARSALTSMPLPSMITSAMVGRTQGDAALGGERRAFSTKFMTKDEKAGYDKMKSDFAKLKPAQKEAVQEAHARDKEALEKSRNTEGYAHTVSDNLLGMYKHQNIAIRKERMSDFRNIATEAKKFENEHKQENKDIDAYNKANKLKAGDEGYRKKLEYNTFNVEALKDPNAKLSDIYSTSVKDSQDIHEKAAKYVPGVSEFGSQFGSIVASIKNKSSTKRE